MEENTETTTDTYLTEKQARTEGFKILAGPFLHNDMKMAYKILDEVKRNNKLAALVERVRGKRKHYEVWQKSLKFVKNT